MYEFCSCCLSYFLKEFIHFIFSFFAFLSFWTRKFSAFSHIHFPIYFPHTHKSTFIWLYADWVFPLFVLIIRVRMWNPADCLEVPSFYFARLWWRWWSLKLCCSMFALRVRPVAFLLKMWEFMNMWMCVWLGAFVCVCNLMRVALFNAVLHIFHFSYFIYFLFLS